MCFVCDQRVRTSEITIISTALCQMNSLTSRPAYKNIVKKFVKVPSIEKLKRPKNFTNSEKKNIYFDIFYRKFVDGKIHGSKCQIKLHIVH